MARRGRFRESAPALIATGLVCLFAGLYLGARWARPELPGTSQEVPPGEPGTSTSPSPQRPAASAAKELDGVAGVRVALVVDDLGRSLAEVEAVARLGVPVTYAVLPFESHTAEVAADLRRRGAEVLCHLPMDPGGHANPGPGALTARMPPRRLAEATAEALAAVPGAAGASNHMGSSLSADRRAMRAVLEVVGASDLFYLDSRTGADSVGYGVALELGIPAAERQVFLDAELVLADIEVQFMRLLAAARERGAAIGIGHPHAETLEVLGRMVPRARAAGYEFVPVSYLLNRGEELPP